MCLSFQDALARNSRRDSRAHFPPLKREGGIAQRSGERSDSIAGSDPHPARSCAPTSPLQGEASKNGYSCASLLLRFEIAFQPRQRIEMRALELRHPARRDVVNGNRIEEVQLPAPLLPCTDEI